MAGLVIIGIYFIYLVISVLVIRFAIRWAKKRGRRPVIWGLLAAFLMYNLVAWDYLPTLLAFKYYAHTESGFWVYKTPEQWKAENPGVAETLTWSRLPLARL
jgi:hypothetical protein